MPVTVLGEGLTVTPNSQCHQRFRAQRDASTLQIATTRWVVDPHRPLSNGDDSLQNVNRQGVGVTVITVRQALADLQLPQSSFSSPGRKRRTFIAEPVIEYDLTSFAGFSEQARVSGSHRGREGVGELNASKAMRRRPRPLAAAEGEEVFGNRSLCASPTDLRVAARLEFPGLSDSPACSVSRSTDRFTNSSSAATTARPVRAVERISPVAAECGAPRAYWTSPAGQRRYLRVEREAFDANGVPV